MTARRLPSPYWVLLRYLNTREYSLSENSLVDLHEVHNWCIVCRMSGNYTTKQRAIHNGPVFPGCYSCLSNGMSKLRNSHSPRQSYSSLSTPTGAFSPLPNPLLWLLRLLPCVIVYFTQSILLVCSPCGYPSTRYRTPWRHFHKTLFGLSLSRHWEGSC